MSKVKPKQFAQAGAVDGDALRWNAANGIWQPQTTISIADYLDRHHSQYPNLVIGDPGANVFVDHFNTSVTLSQVGTYKISVMLFQSMDVIATDFLAEIRVNGAMIGLTTTRIENKDSAGNDGGDGSGTDQKVPIHLTATYANTGAGPVNISLAFAASTADDIPSVHSSELFVERFL